MKTLPKLYFESEIPSFFRELIGAKIDNITLYPAGIFFKKSKTKTDKHVFKEECKHWEQAETLQAKTGRPLSFYFAYYVAGAISGGYGKNPLEKEAKAYAKGDLTQQEQRLWDSN